MQSAPSAESFSDSVAAVSSGAIGYSLQQHIPRIQPDVRLHDGDARFRFPVQNTRGHGGRAAVFGEQGSVDIINARRGTRSERFR